MDSSIPPNPGVGRQANRNGPLHDAFRDLRAALAAEIVGQSALIERLLVALLADGHMLVEGAPGLAKTSAIRALAARLEAEFARVQFTPDLLPADLTGTEVWRPQDGRFEFQPGPIFHPLLLADEINRAPAKVQSALLEAMGERQVTVPPVQGPHRVRFRSGSSTDRSTTPPCRRLCHRWRVPRREVAPCHALVERNKSLRQPNIGEARSRHGLRGSVPCSLAFSLHPPGLLPLV